MFERDDIVKLWGVGLLVGQGFIYSSVVSVHEKNGDTTSL